MSVSFRHNLDEFEGGDDDDDNVWESKKMIG